MKEPRFLRIFQSDLIPNKLSVFIATIPALILMTLDQLRHHLMSSLSFPIHRGARNAATKRRNGLLPRNALAVVLSVIFIGGYLNSISTMLANTKSAESMKDISKQTASDTVVKIDPPESMINKNDPLMVQLLNEGLPSNAKIHKPPSIEQCNSTMVTGYFRLKSKHSAIKYLNWMSNMLSLQDCMVIYTSSDFVETIQKFRNHAPSKTVLIELSVDDLPIAKMGTDFWQRQLDIDKEKKIHQSYQVFWIWLSKSWCVTQAIRHDFFASHQHHHNDGAIFMWQDIGSFRNGEYRGKRILQHTEVIPPGTVLWMAHRRPNPPPTHLWNNKMKQKQFYFQSGSQGAGDVTAWTEFHSQFARTAQQFLDHNFMFIGEDQCVIQSTCQQHPHLCAYLLRSEVKDNNYFGLRYALVNGGKFTRWRFPAVNSP